LNEYVKKYFYEPMGLSTMGFRPRDRFTLDRIAPTESEKYFRLQHLQGDVHDPAAAMLGGVAGSAGLFSNASDLAAVMQMLLNEGNFNGLKYIDEETIRLFTSYNSHLSRRGLGFDKPEKDHSTSADPYPAKSVSPLTFGHTGFTGTSLWIDPATGKYVPQQDPRTLRNFPTRFGDVRLPGYKNWDASISKYFPIHERMRLQFRFEAVNVLNHPWYAAIASVDVTSPQFGRLNPQESNLPRFLKLGLVLQW
jgi:hypothetical protein